MKLKRTFNEQLLPVFLLLFLATPMHELRSDEKTPTENWSALKAIIVKNSPLTTLQGELDRIAYQEIFADFNKGDFQVALEKSNVLRKKHLEKNIKHAWLDKFCEYLESILKFDNEHLEWTKNGNTIGRLRVADKREVAHAAVKQLEEVKQLHEEFKLVNTHSYLATLNALTLHRMYLHDWKGAAEVSETAFRLACKLFGDTSPLTHNSFYFWYRCKVLQNGYGSFSEFEKHLAKIHVELSALDFNYHQLANAFYEDHLESGIVNDLEGLELAYEFHHAFFTTDLRQLYSTMSLQNNQLVKKHDVQTYFDRCTKRYLEWKKKSNTVQMPLFIERQIQFNGDMFHEKFKDAANAMKDALTELNFIRFSNKIDDYNYSHHYFIGAYAGFQAAERSGDEQLQSFFGKQVSAAIKLINGDNIKMHPLLIKKLADRKLYEITEEKREELTKYIAELPKIRADYEKVKPFKIKSQVQAH